ncbi:cytochrome P450 [Clohesyomyces aquaticus]|uniref:Cytochrome P450 n=1 Tax=Clohesyomyces aquaticus TaxID=1231657 RepID=A0A1Y1ZNG5_9PLEO|nr:cytochrome P450 [Clohesyomyces aquaticus]
MAIFAFDLETRIAPDELSFTDPAAIEAIYSSRGAGGHPFSKSAVWHAPQPGKPVSLNNTLDEGEHRRMRMRMEGAFTEKAVGRQEGILRGYVDGLVGRFRALVEKAGAEGVVVDIVPWLTYMAVDAMGDLAFGEAFGCLESGEMDRWIGWVFGSLKAMTLVATLRYYPLADGIVQWCVPSSAKKQVDDLWDAIIGKVNRRLERKTDRPDCISEWLWEGKRAEERLSRDEIYANAFLISIAGSETFATSMSGIMNRLVKNPEALGRLKNEVRKQFPKDEDITLAAMKGLPYLNTVIWEGLRMSHAVPVGLPRLTPWEGGTVCGQWIPGNTFVNAHPLSISLSPKFFHLPLEFRPERWLLEATKPSSPFFSNNRNGLQPFSIGPRSCIGRPFGLAQIRLALAKMVWMFDMEKADTKAGGLRWEDQKTFTVVEKLPYEIKLKIRES